MKYGYIRIAEMGMSIEQQTQLLLDAGCERLFTEITRAGNPAQTAWQDLLTHLKNGDVVMLATLDRLSGSLFDLITTLLTFQEQGIEFISVLDKLDSTSSENSIMLKTLRALQRYEQERIKEKTKTGLRSARARGKLGGRPRKMDNSRSAMAKSLYKDKKHSIDDICNIMKVSRATLYRYLK